MKFSHNGRRLSGLVIPLSAIRSDDSPGCGEFPDLSLAGDLASSWGLELIQLLPVNDSGYQNSPYSALSAFALHPIYLRIGDLPELAEMGGNLGKAGDRPRNSQDFRAEARALVRQFAGEERIPHEALLRAKLGLLRKIWAKATESRGPASQGILVELDAWIAANPWSKSYSAFVALKSMNEDRPWWEWPHHRDPSVGDIEALWGDRALSAELHFWTWVQMRAAQQFRAAALSLVEKGIALMGDIPILMNADSADVWARRSSFLLGLSAGAPPDMYSSLGQNWGFPIYNWEVLEREGFSFWVDRLAEADKYYSCYRIDHVLGFFRIWSLSERESTGALGRFVPDVPATRTELESLGFSAERLRWLSQPHIPTQRLIQVAGESAAKGAVSAALERIGEEDLFLFKNSIMGEKDIEALPSISPAARDCLLAAWRDRAIFEYEPGCFVPTCNFRTTTSWATLSDEERGKLETCFGTKRTQAEDLWASTGKRLLGALAKAVPMLPCAEDLGSVPECVPKVLQELGILGLRVFRWARRWNESGQPYTPLADYPELSVACPSVHDSSSIREWWEVEADRERTWSFVSSALGIDAGPCPDRLNTEQVAVILELMARSASRFAVYPIQDILAMSDKLRPADPKSERINVPGTVGTGNWAYRVPWSTEEILAEKKLVAKVRALAKARTLSKKAHGKTQDSS
jgi:4-alpha-glucanotransferase